jgi:hypothetical protein
MIRRIMVAPTMSSPFAVLFTLAASTIRSRDALQSEILALLTLTGRFLKQCAPTPAPKLSDQRLWVLLSRFWSGGPVVCRSFNPRGRSSVGNIKTDIMPA